MMSAQPSLQDLPGPLYGRIFSFLTFEDVSMVRCTSRALEAAATIFLREAFQRLGPAIQHQLQRARDPDDAARLSDKRVAKCHALCLVSVEYRLLRAVCWRHMRRDRPPFFFPGRLLDIFYRIVHMTGEHPAKERSPKYHSILLEMTYALTRLLETFIGFHERQQRKPWPRGAASTCFGAKFVDLLDCCLGHVCKFSLVFSEAECLLVGRYQCPLSGYLNCPGGAAPRRIHPHCEAEVSGWLRDLRELVRKSNQQYVDDLLKHLRADNGGGSAGRAGLSLFEGRSGSKPHGGGGSPGSLAYWRKMDPGVGPSFGLAYLCAKVEMQLPVDELPLELRCDAPRPGDSAPAGEPHGFSLRCEVCVSGARLGHVIFRPSYCLQENRRYINFTGVISSENDLKKKLHDATKHLDTAVQRTAASKTQCDEY